MAYRKLLTKRTHDELLELKRLCEEYSDDDYLFHSFLWIEDDEDVFLIWVFLGEESLTAFKDKTFEGIKDKLRIYNEGRYRSGE